MDKSTLNQLILLAAATVLPTISAFATAWLKKRKWIPSGVRDWLGKVSDADILASVVKAAELVKATPAERQEFARKYLQDKINAQLLLTEGVRLVIDAKTGEQTRTNVLPSSVANYFIEKKIQELK